MPSTKRSDWDVEIKAETPLLDIDLRALWRYRDLVMMFVRRDFVALYKQTVLGPLWYLLQPVLTTAVFTIVFNRIAKISTDGTPPFLFYMSGVVMWQYFSNCLGKTSDVFTSNANVFGKVFFPRLTVPLASLITNLISFAIQFALLVGLIVYVQIQGGAVNINVAVLILPLLLFQAGLLGLGTGILLSSLTTRYRDLNFLVGFGIQLWMYATPIVYPLSQVPEQWRWLVALNPMTPIVELFKIGMLGTGTVAASHAVMSIGTTLVVLVVGLLVFTRMERTSVDTV